MPTLGIHPHDPGLWDQRFDHPELAYGAEPSLFLVEQNDLFRPGQSVLVPADGEGRNGLWLARRGLHVTCVDFAGVGLAKMKVIAERENLSLTAVHHDLLTWPWPHAHYDHVVSIYFHIAPEHRRRMHRAMREALAPGGYLLIEGFHRDQFGRSSGGPRDVAMLYDEATLRADFEGMDIQVLRRDEIVLDEGRLHQGPAVLTRMLARK
jgi:SAM-dependent methyltransferase